MRRFIGCIVMVIFGAGPVSAKTIESDCLGSPDAKGHLIYLHGLTAADQDTQEEGENRKVLEQLAQNLSLRIALPRGSLCPNGKLCWPARDKNEVLRTFEKLKEQAQKCWTGQSAYSVLGFSNGGYFAFKLYKIHQDPKLIHILATGSAGTWDSKVDRVNPASRFSLMIGRKDITLKKASQLADILRRAISGFRFETFSGGHRLDYGTSKLLLEAR